MKKNKNRGDNKKPEGMETVGLGDAVGGEHPAVDQIFGDGEIIVGVVGNQVIDILLRQPGQDQADEKTKGKKITKFFGDRIFD